MRADICAADVVIELDAPIDALPAGARLGAYIDEDGAHACLNGRTIDIAPSGYRRVVVVAVQGGDQVSSARAEEYQEAKP